MKISLILILFSFISCSFGQVSLSDQPEDFIVNFKSVLIDYEIYQDKTVALTKDNGEYFIYYTDPSGAGLFQTFDIFFATDLELDNQGRLYLVGLDSAYQLTIGSHVEVVATYGVSDFRMISMDSDIYFDETVAYTNWGSLTFQWINPQEHSSSPTIAYYQFGEDFYSPYSSGLSRSSRTQATSLDHKLVVDRNTNIQNDIVSSRGQTNGASLSSQPVNRKTYQADDLLSFRVNDSLWLVNQTINELSVYSSYGVQHAKNVLSPSPYKSKVVQDPSTEKIYFITNSFGITSIQELSSNGTLNPIAELRKGMYKSDLKISNGYLYYLDSKGSGESIKRVKLD